jgi:hypothetical protein
MRSVAFVLHIKLPDALWSKMKSELPVLLTQLSLDPFLISSTFLAVVPALTL